MAKKQVTIPIFVPHLGCPHRCVFCNQWESTGSKALPDRESIAEKIRSYLSRIAPSVERIEAAFFGGSFTGIPAESQRELLGAVHEFLESGQLHGIRLSTRPDYIDSDKLALLKSFGVDTVELGVQSFSERVLGASGRGHGEHDVYRAVELLREGGFKFIIQLMPGLPGDTPEESIRSARIAADLAPDGVRVYPTVVLQSTALADLYIRNEYEPLTLESAIELCKEIQVVFIEKNIPVIRMGLHPFSPEEEKNILAGPYHPAFGFLVRSRIQRDVMEALLEGFLQEEEDTAAGGARILIPFSGKEECLGHRRENIAFLKRRFGMDEIEYRIVREEGISIESRS